MTETPLYTALMEHCALHRAAFHTPGHKNNPAALPDDLLSLDFTELPDTDSLFEAEGPIPVSYTHLAVYKSQIRGFPRCRPSPLQRAI